MERAILVMPQLHQEGIGLLDDRGRYYRLRDQRDDQRSRLKSPYNHQVTQVLVMEVSVLLMHIFYTRPIIRYSQGKGGTFDSRSKLSQF